MIDDEAMGELLFMTMEGEVVRALISGNDTQCFTTTQYDDAREKWLVRFVGATRESLGMTRAPIETARKQLRACPYLVEVKPDTWTLRSLLDQGEPSGEG